MITDDQVKTLIDVTEAMAVSMSDTTQKVNDLSITSAVVAEQIAGLRSDVNDLKQTMKALPCEDEKIAKIRMEEQLKYLAREAAFNVVTPQIQQQASEAAREAVDARARGLLIKAVGLTASLVTAIVMGIVEFFRAGGGR